MLIDYTGERFIPGMPVSIELEHMHRYVLAAKFAQGKRVLDVASGEGYGSHLLAQVADSVIGVDISSEAIEHAKSNYHQPNLVFRVGDCAQLPVDSASVDLVVSFETIEHHDQHAAMLSEIWRVLKPDGVLILSSPNKHTYSDIPGTHNQFHVKELYLDEFEALLRKTFPHVELYGQRAALASVITPLNDSQASFEWISGSRDQFVCSSISDTAVYFLAVASKTLPLSRLPSSAFQIDKPADLYSEIAPVMFQTKMYWRSHWTEKNNGYTEERSVADFFPADVPSKTVRLVLPEGCGRIERIRLDILNSIGGVDLNSITIVSPDEYVIWQWSGDVTELQDVVQAVLVPELSGLGTCTVLSLGHDPWFELGLDETLYEQIKPGCALILEVGPFHLLDRLASIVKELLNNAISIQKVPVQLPAKFADNLGSLATLVESALSRRDEVIREQGRKLSQMHHDLTRAEAQLDLLKDVMLVGREEDRF